MPQPARQVCPLCASDEDYTVEVEAPGLWRLTCTASHGGSPYSWLTTGRGPFDHAGQDGHAESIGLYDDLVSLIHAGEPWLEYGIVEYRYAQAQPSLYAALVNEYGHVARGSKPYTASAFIGAALGHLRRDGLLSWRACKATGRWSYNGEISAWAHPGQPDNAPLLSWSEFAAAEGFSPEEWPPLPAS